MNSQQNIIINRYFTKEYPNFYRVLEIYEQVFLYKFNKSWIDADIEGKLYIYNCKNSKNIFFVIFHKKQMKKLNFEIKENYKIDIKDNFLIIGEELQEKYIGLWFSNKEEAINAFNFLKNWNYNLNYH